MTLEVRMHAPTRGFFAGTFPALIDTPEVLVGTLGEIARRVRTLGTHSALYQVHALGEALATEVVHPATYDEATDTHGPATQTAVMVLDAAPEGVAPEMVVHPSVGDNVAELVPTVYLAGVEASVHGPFPESIDPTLHVRRWVASTDSATLLLWASVRSWSPVIDLEGVVLTHDRRGRRVPVTVSFGEPVLAHGEDLRARGHLLEGELDVPTAGIAGPFVARLACRSWSDANPDNHLSERSADELEHAAGGPWYGIPCRWPGLWFGARPLDPALYERSVADTVNAWLKSRSTFFDSTEADPRPWIPRVNPNVGGTDPAFGHAFLLPLASRDPRIVRALLWSSTAWGEHPCYYTEPGSIEPIAAPPAHPELRTHKLQPDGGRIDDVEVPTPDEKPGKRPFDPQHRPFALPLAVYALTGSPALKYLLELWLGSEMHDKRARNQWLGSGREEGRIATHVCSAIELGLGDRTSQLGYLRTRLHTAMNDLPGKDSGGPIRALFTIKRGVPWPAWTPWEEAKAAWGWWRLYTLDGSNSALWAAVDCAANVVQVLAQSGGRWWLPYRVRWIEDGSLPTVTLESADIVDPLFGPNGLFSWGIVAARVLLLADAARGPTLNIAPELLERAALAVSWCDQNQREHVVDAHSSLRGTARDLALRVIDEALAR